MTTSVSWQRLRKLVKNKYGSICYHCGRYADNGHCDHLIPLSKGGTDAIDNLVWSCSQCNLRKSNNVPEIVSKQILDQFDIPQADIIKPNFNRILPELLAAVVSFFVTPYPEWNLARFGDYITYFETIMSLRRMFPITTWLRERIWPISKNLRLILFTLDTLNDLEREIKIKPKNYIFRFDVCPKCKAPVTMEFESDYKVFFNWTCEGGHNGMGINKFSDWYIPRMETASIEWAWQRTEPKPPDPWGRD